MGRAADPIDPRLQYLSAGGICGPAAATAQDLTQHATLRSSNFALQVLSKRPCLAAIEDRGGNDTVEQAKAHVQRIPLASQLMLEAAKFAPSCVQAMGYLFLNTMRKGYVRAKVLDSRCVWNYFDLHAMCINEAALGPVS